MMQVSLVIELKEYEAAERPMSLEQAYALRRAAGNALVVSAADQPGLWTVRANSMVGTVVTPDVQVLITPKVDGANLFHLLEADGEALEVGDEVFEYGVSGDVVGALATFYARHLERAVAGGIARRYREEVDRLDAVRGRVEVRQLVSAGGLPLPVACRFDEHSADTQLNRIVVAAAQRLARSGSTVPATRRTLLRLIGAFESTGPLRPSDLHTPTRFTRLEQHFRSTEGLARIVLASSSITDRAGRSEAGSFTVDMNFLYERFIESRLRRYLRNRLAVAGQYRTHLDVERSVAMRPDLVLSSTGMPVYVADAKYKLTADGRGRDRDYYQLLAYCTALGLPEGMLIYCQHDGTAPPREITVRGPAGARLVTAAVQLSGRPQDLEDRMRALADDLAERSRSTRAA